MATLDTEPGSNIGQAPLAAALPSGGAPTPLTISPTESSTSPTHSPTKASPTEAHTEAPAAALTAAPAEAPSTETSHTGPSHAEPSHMGLSHMGLSRSEAPHPGASDSGAQVETSTGTLAEAPNAAPTPAPAEAAATVPTVVPPEADGGVPSAAPTEAVAAVPIVVPAEADGVVPPEADGAPADAPAGTGRRLDIKRRLWDLVAVVGFIAAALYLTSNLWRDSTGVTGTNIADQSFFEWMLAHGVRVVTHLEYPFFSNRMNMPDGVNLMANTSILGLSLPLAPVTLLFGPHVTFNLLVVAAFAATGIAWYYVLSRHLVASRGAALLGAAFCAFAPGMMSHGNGHPNLVAQFLVPFIIWRTLRLREPGRAIRNGVVLGLLVTWQAFINEEILLLTAFGLAMFCLIAVAGGVLRGDFRRQFWSFLAGLAVASAVAGALLAYPLSVQFFGPSSYHGLSEGIKQFGANLAAYPAFSRLSLAGSEESVRGLTQNPTEENSFLGWPLLILLALLILWMCRSVIAMAVAVVGVVFALASLGPTIQWHGERLGRGPWAMAQQLPVLNTVVPTRFAFATVPVVGLLLALAWDRWRDRVAVPARTRLGSFLQYASYVLPAVYLAALLPLVPRALPDMPRQPTPALIASGQLSRYLSDGGSVLFIPTPRNAYPQPLAWAADTGLSFRMSQGYFLGPAQNPEDPADRHATLSTWPRPTDSLLNRVWGSGRVPTITAEMREQAVVDLRHWRTAVIVQVASGRNEVAVRTVTTGLVGVRPQQVGGAWMWDVRQFVKS